LHPTARAYFFNVASVGECTLADRAVSNRVTAGGLVPIFAATPTCVRPAFLRAGPGNRRRPGNRVRPVFPGPLLVGKARQADPAGPAGQPPKWRDLVRGFRKPGPNRGKGRFGFQRDTSNTPSSNFMKFRFGLCIARTEARYRVNLVSSPIRTARSRIFRSSATASRYA